MNYDINYYGKSKARNRIKIGKSQIQNIINTSIQEEHEVNLVTLCHYYGQLGRMLS